MKRPGHETALPLHVVLLLKSNKSATIDISFVVSHLA